MAETQYQRYNLEGKLLVEDALVEMEVDVDFQQTQPTNEKLGAKNNLGRA